MTQCYFSFGSTLVSVLLLPLYASWHKKTIASIGHAMLHCVWEELFYRLEVCQFTKGTPVTYYWQKFEVSASIDKRIYVF